MPPNDDSAPDRLVLVMKDRAATIRLGTAIGAGLVPGTVIALVGDLGTGKTTLVQGIARGIEYPGAVTSPTYTLIHEYAGRVPLVHVDPYRLDRPEEIFTIGLEEYLEQQFALVAEWSDRIAAWLPADRLTVRIEMLEKWAGDGIDSARSVTLTASGTDSRRILALIEHACKAGSVHVAHE